MRAFQWLLGLATAGAMVGVVGAGCGGSSEATPADSGADVTADQGTPDTAAEATMEAAPPMDAGCMVDADITMLNVPDAAIGDSGASTDQCYACIQTTCPQQLSACNMDCTCKTEVVQFLTCMAMPNATITSCGSSFVGGGTGGPGLPLVGCIGGSASGIGTGPGCLKECGVTIPEGGMPPSDAGPTDAGGQ